MKLIVMSLNNVPLLELTVCIEQLIAEAEQLGEPIIRNFGCSVMSTEITISPGDDLSQLVEKVISAGEEACKSCKEITANVEILPEMTLRPEALQKWEELKNEKDKKVILFANEWACYMEAWRIKNNGKLSLAIAQRTQSLVSHKHALSHYVAIEAADILSKVWIHGRELIDITDEAWNNF